MFSYIDQYIKDQNEDWEAYIIDRYDHRLLYIIYIILYIIYIYKSREPKFTGSYPKAIFFLRSRLYIYFFNLGNFNWCIFASCLPFPHFHSLVPFLSDLLDCRQHRQEEKKIYKIIFPMQSPQVYLV